MKILESTVTIARKGLRRMPKNTDGTWLFSGVRVIGDFYIMNNNLSSLEGSPEYVSGDFICYGNEFTNLIGAPKHIGGKLNVSVISDLTSLRGCPHINEHLDCAECSLTDLIGITHVGKDIDCSYNQLTSLKGCPEAVHGNFNCRRNKLTSLKHGPKKVHGDFDCSGNYLTSLDDCPAEVHGDFICHDNKKHFSKEEVMTRCKVHGEILNELKI